MMWIVSLVMFWVGGCIGFILGAWWVAAHTQERQMDACCDTGTETETGP